MRYQIVKGYDAEDLTIQVNAAIVQGWQLQGGVAVVQRLNDPDQSHQDDYYSTLYDSGLQYAQAMIKIGEPI